MHIDTPFVWFDLFTDDLEEAAAFYEGVFGWTLSEDAGAYPAFRVGGRGVAGLLPLRGEEAVPHWIGHLAVDDVDTVCRRMQFLQGHVLMEPEDLEGVGRTALLADPGGATLAPFAAAGDPSEPPRDEGGIAWATLVAPRADLALKLYKNLVTWSDGGATDSPVGPYRVLKARSRRVAGLIDQRDLEADAQWLPHVHVADLEAALDRADDHDAAVLVPTIEVPRVGTLAVVSDPRGAPVGLIQPA